MSKSFDASAAADVHSRPSDGAAISVRSMSIKTPRGVFGVRESGSVGGQPVVLLHPLASSGRLWDGVSAQLGDAGYRVLALDARGHGQSPWDGRAFSVRELAEDAAAVMDELGIPVADVVGMSMGGCTALELALQRPDLVRRLVLADTTASYGPDRVQQWEERAVQAEGSPRESLLDFQLTRWFSDNFRDADPAACSHASAVFAETSSVVHAAACRALGGFDVSAKLSGVQSEALVLVGEEDYATPPAMAQALAAGMPHARLQILSNTRHYSLIENQEVWRAIREHLTGGVAG